MAIVYPNMVPKRAEIHLDVTASSGEPVREMLPKYWRPMALCRSKGELWYGFVINDSSVESISPGQSVTCMVSFLNHEDAQNAFPTGASILFGDGFTTRGVMRLV